MDETPLDRIAVQSGLAHGSGAPAVVFQVDLPKFSLDVTDARGLALQILEAAEAAETDAMVVEMMGGKGVPEAEKLIAFVRHKRAEHLGHRPGERKNN